MNSQGIFALSKDFECTLDDIEKSYPSDLVFNSLLPMLEQNEPNYVYFKMVLSLLERYSLVLGQIEDLRLIESLIQVIMKVILGTKL
jgi:hypothetical protein